MSSETMPNWLYKRAALTPERIALKLGEDAWTFAELNKRAQATANKLLSLGIKQGEHIAILSCNNLEMVEIIHALEYVGAVSVLLNNRLTAYEIAYQLKDADVSYCIYEDIFTDKIMETNKYMDAIQTITIEKLQSQKVKKQSALMLEISLDQLHTIIYTSGTTGKPKGVMLTYGNHWWSAIGSVLNLGLDTNDRWMVCLPLFHVSGLSILLRSVIYGISVIVHQSFDPKRINQSIVDDHVTIISVVSTMLMQMIDSLEASSYPEHLRCVLLGGGSVPKPLLQKSTQLRIPVYQTYGMTESASQIVTLGPEYIQQKQGSAGKPLFPAQLKIVDQDQELEPGKVGEIVVKGPNITKGYYKREEPTRQCFQQGWFYTGDLGYLDQDGFLFILDRRNDLIISGGENIYPAEIEAVLLSHIEIEDVGVIGRSDLKWGQVPIAFVQIESGKKLLEEELVAFCKERLASYKVPASIYFIDQLPRNASKKLLRRKLKQLLQNLAGNWNTHEE